MIERDNSPPPETDFAIRPLTPADAAVVARVMADQPADYLRFFYALGAGEAEIEAVLRARQRDVYSGIFWRDELICLFMLRGWDEGYETPTFGLFVAEGHGGRHVTTTAMEAGKLIARLEGAARIMVKVHPDNRAATRIASHFGFVAASTEAETGNVVYYLDL